MASSVSRFAAVTVGAWLVLTMPAVIGQVPQPKPAAEVSPAAEFPPTDMAIFSAQQQGASAKLAAARMRQADDSPESIQVLVQANRLDDALSVLDRIAQSHPDRLADAYAIVGREGIRFVEDQSRGYAPKIQERIDAVRKRLTEMPREDAAHLARQLLSAESMVARGGSGVWAQRISAFAREYTGTTEGDLAAIDVIESGHNIAQEIIDFDAFAKAHPGTEPGAKALYMKGFELSGNVAMTGIEKRGSDPTERFLQVIDIVGQLEHGGYPSCEWVRKAPELVYSFFASQPNYSPENLDRTIAAYRTFVAAHFTVDDRAPLGNSIGYVVTSKMGALFKLKGQGAEAIEGVLDELEKAAGDKSPVRYMKAEFYISRMHADVVSERPVFAKKAADTLSDLASHSTGLYQRKALATLAAMHFYEREYPAAIDACSRYLAEYPHTSWSWVAALRIGQANEEAGDWAAAAAAYRRAATAYSDLPLAVVLGHAFAANADQALGQFDGALTEFEQALAGWDRDYGIRYMFNTSHTPLPQPQVGAPRPSAAEVTREALTSRLAVLRQFAGLPGGNDLERGRWLTDRGKFDDAIVALNTVMARYPESTAAPEARVQLHRATLLRLLAIADVEAATTSATAARAGLEALVREPWDPNVGMAGIAEASLLWKQGAAADAQALMTRTLDEWRAHQPRTAGPIVPAGLTDADVAAIRDVIFLPLGGGVYGTGRWNGFSWPATASPFLIVNPDVQVKAANGDVTHVSLPRPIAGFDNVLFMNADQQAMLNSIITSLGGTKTRPPGAVMETPNQPVGPSMDILGFWNQYFASRPGHWGGWVFETYPIITQIEFQNTERTKAAAAVTIGYAGATVVLEKIDGVWKAIKLVNNWVT